MAGFVGRKNWKLEAVEATDLDLVLPEGALPMDNYILLDTGNTGATWQPDIFVMRHGATKMFA